MGRRSFSCLAAAAMVACCCCCLAQLVRPVHGGRAVGTGLVGASASGGGEGRRLLSDEEPRFHGAHQVVKELRRGVTVEPRPSSSTADGRVGAELRSVPGGPDPLHHHGSPRRPEQQELARHHPVSSLGRRRP